MLCSSHETGWGQDAKIVSENKKNRGEEFDHPVDLKPRTG